VLFSQRLAYHTLGLPLLDGQFAGFEVSEVRVRLGLRK